MKDNTKLLIAVITFGIAYVAYHKFLKKPTFSVESIDHVNKAITFKVNGELHTYQGSQPQIVGLNNGYSIELRKPTSEIIRVNFMHNGSLYKNSQLIKLSEIA